MAGHDAGHDVRDELDRIGGARVFGLRVVESRSSFARRRVADDVFEHGAETVRRRPDLGLGCLRELDALRVAAAFEVEDAVGRPAVLVVADERALRIGRKRRLAGAGEAEEDGDVAGFARCWPSSASESTSRSGMQVVHDRENGLLDLARVARAADQDQPLAEVEQDEGAAIRAVTRADRR